MSTTSTTAFKHTHKLASLIEALEKIKPKSCSKPKSKMCQKCLDRVTSENALSISFFIKKLNQLKDSNTKLDKATEAQVIELINKS